MDTGLPEIFSTTLREAAAFTWHINQEGLLGAGTGFLLGYGGMSFLQKAMGFELAPGTRKSRFVFSAKIIIGLSAARFLGISQHRLGEVIGAPEGIISLPEIISRGLTWLADFNTNELAPLGLGAGMLLGWALARTAKEALRPAPLSRERPPADPLPPSKETAYEIIEAFAISRESRPFTDVQTALKELSATVDAAPQNLEALQALRYCLDEIVPPVNATEEAPTGTTLSRELVAAKWTPDNVRQLRVAADTKIVEISRAVLMAFTAEPTDSSVGTPAITAEALVSLSIAVTELGRIRPAPTREEATLFAVDRHTEPTPEPVLTAQAADAPTLQSAIMKMLRGWETITEIDRQRATDKGEDPATFCLRQALLEGTIRLWIQVAEEATVTTAVPSLAEACVPLVSIDKTHSPFDGVTSSLPLARAAEFHVYYTAGLLNALAGAEEAARAPIYTALSRTREAIRAGASADRTEGTEERYSAGRTALLDHLNQNPLIITQSISGLGFLMELPQANFRSAAVTNALEMAVELVGWIALIRTSNIQQKMENLQLERQFLWPIVAAAVDRTALDDAKHYKKKSSIFGAIATAIAAAAEKKIAEEIKPRLYKSGTEEVLPMTAANADSILGLISAVEALVNLTFTDKDGEEKLLLKNGRKTTITTTCARLTQDVHRGRIQAVLGDLTAENFLEKGEPVVAKVPGSIPDLEDKIVAAAEAIITVIAQSFPQAFPKTGSAATAAPAAAGLSADNANRYLLNLLRVLATLPTAIWLSSASTAQTRWADLTRESANKLKRAAGAALVRLAWLNGGVGAATPENDPQSNLNWLKLITEDVDTMTAICADRENLAAAIIEFLRQPRLLSGQGQPNATAEQVAARVREWEEAEEMATTPPEDASDPLGNLDVEGLSRYTNGRNGGH
jgi:hypothetical protein